MRRAGWIALAAVAAGWWWCGGGDGARRARSAASPQAAVLDGGFVVIDGDGGRRRVVELDRDGGVEWEARIAVPDESRVVGTRIGTGVVWRDGDKIAIARVTDDGKLGKPERYGTHARMMCDGVATTDKRWAVGWLESDGVVWFLHGPTASSAESVAVQTVQRTTWCGVAAAPRDRVVLLWRDGADRVALTYCTKRECGGLPDRLPADLARQTLLAVGCLKDGCGFVTRDAGGVTRLTWRRERGKIEWTRELDADRDAGAALTAVGDRHLAVGYVGVDGHAVVDRVDRKGAEARRIWRADAAGDGAPALAWSRDRLLVAYTRDGALVTAVVR
jgi:hypothetical protein